VPKLVSRKKQLRLGGIKMLDITWMVWFLFSLFLLVFVYHFCLFIASLAVSPTPPSPKSHKPFNFLVLIPAHNEELVIGDIIRDMLCQTYSRDFWRVIIVADNCTDSTLQICKKFENNQLRVLERRSEQKGKGLALDYGLINAETIFSEFLPDYVVVFDADNRVPETFLEELSLYTDKDCAAVQCNVKTKEPKSFLAKLELYEYLIMYRLWQGGKKQLGLFNSLAGQEKQ